MAISVGAALLVVLVGGQLLAPAIATIVLRHRLAKDGRVIGARVSAFPWVQLLWQHADRVSVRMADYSAPPSRITTLLQEAEGVGALDISIGVIHTGLLTLHEVSFSKHGDAMVGAAQLDLRDLQAALPIVRSLTPVHDADGQLVLRGSASVLGVNASVDVAVTASDGKLVVAPTGLFGAFATVTLFEDPQIRVQSVSASAVRGGVRFVARGQVR
ncbi:MAG TPA: hypothetical protein VHU61_01665 [Solirubrobacteraceae bacterium]|nr:hypothetical protein [Solirubrobacteraceae bacterium]